MLTLTRRRPVRRRPSLRRWLTSIWSGFIVAGYNDGSIVVWSKTGKKTFELLGHRGIDSAVCVHG